MGCLRRRAAAGWAVSVGAGLGGSRRAGGSRQQAGCTRRAARLTAARLLPLVCSGKTVGAPPIAHKRQMPRAVVFTHQRERR